MNYYLGVDFGTSGARAVTIDSQKQVQATASISFPLASPHWANVWRETLFALIAQIPAEIRQQIRSIAINGTSSTVLLCNAEGQPLDQPIFYHDDRGKAVLDWVKSIAPANHTVVSATSSLAKLLWWMSQNLGEQSIATRIETQSGDWTIAHPPSFFLHQADWLAFLLHGKLGISDYHNALKLGYDVGELRYPDWMQQLPPIVQLPEVLAPGTPIAAVTDEVADRWGLSRTCQVCAGTTDSIAAFLASEVQAPGEAVTSLGSTLVLKLLSETRVDNAQYGIYSHRLGDLWLVGGASNTGGAVLQQFFSHADLDALSEQIDPNQESQLHYYPLLKPGERFPVNNPQLLPQLEPRPDRSVEFLHGLLESMARIEAEGYQLLQSFGASPLQCIYTAGGGAKNPTWAKIRSRRLGVPVRRSKQTEAAFGTALLAMSNEKPGG